MSNVVIVATCSWTVGGNKMILLRNGNFEADWGEEKSHRCLVFPSGEERDVGNIFTPPGWLTWFRHKPDTWDQPEVRDAWKSGDPRRVHGGEKGMLLFTFYRKHDAGFLQQIQVAPGTKLRLTAWAHAWSNWQEGPHPDDGHWSDGEEVGYNAFFALEGDVNDDAARNFTFYVGIDPTGGTNPYADSVVWGRGAHIYNEYAQVPAVEATAESDTVTVFLRSKTLWAFKHNDAYWDDVEMSVISEPEPEPTPTEWGYPVIEQGSKLGVHAILADGVPGYVASLAEAGTHFPVVKAVDDLDWLVGVKEASPDTIAIGRIVSDFEHCQEVADGAPDLNDLADRLLGLILERIDGNPHLRDAIDYWEICNEPDPPGSEGYRLLAELMKLCMSKAEAHSLKLGLFVLNAGTPEWDEMEAMVETGVFSQARNGGHILTLHEGVFSPNDPIDKWHGDVIPGSPVVEGAGPLCFRYRYLYHLLEQRGEVVPLVVSEWCGYDQRELSASEIVQRVAWYDRLAREDYYIWAFCPFTLGPTSSWTTHDYAKSYPALIEYMVGIKDDPNGLPSEPEPQPSQPCRGAPREQYERTYVLLPPTAGVDWVHALANATWDNHRYTIGASADDAGLGDLDVRRVIAVNPGDWSGDLEAFYQEHYPGVEMVSVEAASPVELLALLSEEL